MLQTPFSIAINYFNKSLKLIVLYGFIGFFSFSMAGSYEDFLQATKNDEVKVVSNLLSRGFDPNTVSLDGEPSVFMAWKNESLKVFEALIKHPKTNLNVKNTHSETILMLVCLKGHFNLAQTLVARKADINQPGWTPLHYATVSGNTAIVKLLIDESAYIDAESPNGTTPLMMAAKYGNSETVKLLISEGADVQAKNQLNLTVLDFAKDAVKPDAIKLIEAAMLQANTPSKAK